jgi:DNA-binding transcriptional MerR regulator
MPKMAAPKRELFKAADVCEVVQVQPYVLRSWEAEFPQIGQVPAGGGPRLYRRSDVELVMRIKQLVFEEGLTLSGARRRLEEDNGERNGAPHSSRKCSATACASSPAGEIGAAPILEISRTMRIRSELRLGGHAEEEAVAKSRPKK